MAARGAGADKPGFEPYVLHPMAGGDQSTGSPAAYVRSYLGHNLRATLIDQRVIEGKFTALDSNGAFIMCNATEHCRGRTRKMERVVIPLQWIQALDAVR
jgi:hypothetical protein